MSRADIASLLTFTAFALAGLAAMFWLRSVAGFVTFALIGVFGSIAASQVFDSLASAEERRRELEDRVRNPPS